MSRGKMLNQGRIRSRRLIGLTSRDGAQFAKPPEY